MRRRTFIQGITASTVWPLAAGAQPTDGTRRIGLLIGWSKNNPEFRGLIATFVEELARLGWVDGRNARIEERWTEADGERGVLLQRNSLHGDLRFYSHRPRQRRQLCTE
jgi:putative tryptophan/tyrosine transport system substrate-binding protein